jgi:Ca2+-binding RTX toxin-like protein
MRLALAVALLLVLPATSSASTAKVVIADSCGEDVACGKYDGGHPVAVVTCIAEAGEANRLAVSRAGAEVTISDPGAVIAAQDGCRSAGPHAATCAAGGPEPIPGFVAQLGDGADTLAVAGGLGVLAQLHGGDGDDVLAGGDEEDVLDGGPGADRVDGGGGTDVLSFAGRSESVTVDLAARRTSDGDVLGGLEVVAGGDGPDRLLGGAAGEALRGGEGDDVIRGQGGDDVLDGELGADTIDGGAGDDEMSGDPPQGDAYYTPIIRLRRDVLRGGPGDDRLTDSAGANLLAGGSGDDLLVGGSGADRIVGGPGTDQLWGHGGRDRLFARDRRRDLVRCGSGRDTARIDAQDGLRACEKVLPRRYTHRR